MGLHADRLHWAGDWFKWFSYLNLVVVALALIGIVLVVLSGRSAFPISGRSITSVQLITNEIAAAVGSLLIAFLWRVAYFICDFFGDFASGLHAQQIKRERLDKS